MSTASAASGLGADFDLFMNKVVDSIIYNRKEEIQKDLWDRLSEQEKEAITRSFYDFCVTKSDVLIKDSWSTHSRGFVRQVVESQIRKAVIERLQELDFRTMVKEFVTEDRVREHIVSFLDAEISIVLGGIRVALSNVKQQIRNSLY